MASTVQNHPKKMLGVVLVAVLASCGSHDSAQPEATPKQTQTPASDRRALDLPGDANGVLWDGSALLLTDNTHGQIARWRDDTGFSTAATAGDKVSLGGLVKTGDDIVTTSFGFGKDGGVLVVGASTHAVPNLDPVRRRIGIARAPDGALFDVYFVATKGQPKSGGLAQLDVATGEHDLVTDLGKPVGVAATADAIYVTDQDTSEILAFKRDGSARRMVARVASVDLLTLLPDGDLLTGGKSGGVYRVHPATGAVTTVASGFAQVRGIAYDPAGKRLFVVEHSPDNTHHLYIVPFDAGAR